MSSEAWIATLSCTFHQRRATLSYSPISESPANWPGSAVRWLTLSTLLLPQMLNCLTTTSRFQIFHSFVINLEVHVIMFLPDLGIGEAMTASTARHWSITTYSHVSCRESVFWWKAKPAPDAVHLLARRDAVAPPALWGTLDCELVSTLLSGFVVPSPQQLAPLQQCWLYV